MNLPNALTVSRIFFTPVLLAVMLQGRFTIDAGFGLSITQDWVALAIFLGAALTDFLDGFLARRRKQVTLLGRMLDPIADKLLISAAFICLIELGRAPAWAVVLIVGREFAVSGLRYAALAESVAISASPLGKAKMHAQVAAVALLLVAPDHVTAAIALTAAIVLSIVSMADYFRVFRPAERRGAAVSPASKGHKIPSQAS